MMERKYSFAWLLWLTTVLSTAVALRLLALLSTWPRAARALVLLRDGLGTTGFFAAGLETLAIEVSGDKGQERQNR